MGKMDCLRNKVEPFDVLFWALGNVFANTPDPVTLPSGPASLHRRTWQHDHVRTCLDQFSMKTCCPPPFLIVVCYLSMGTGDGEWG